MVHWQYNSGRILHELKEDRQTSCAAFSPDATHFATVGSESYVAIYNEATGALVRKLDARCALESTYMLYMLIKSNWFTTYLAQV